MSNTSGQDQIHLPELAGCCQRLLAGAAAQLQSVDRARIALGTIELVCAQCGNRLKPAEILELADSGASTEPAPRVARLRQGYCPRADCNSYYYRLRLPRVEGLDWTKALTDLDGAGLPAGPDAAVPATTTGLRSTAAWRLGTRIAAAAALLLLLFLARQWYIGGTIPILREPERFQIDPRSVDRPVPP